MGNFPSNFTFMAKRKEAKVLMAGLYGAGKSTMLEKLEMGPITRTTPVKGLNIESATFSNIVVTAYDSDCKLDQTKPPFPDIMKGTKVLVYVVDSSATLSVVHKAREDLKALLQLPFLRGIPLLVCGNMQDMNAAGDEEQIIEKLNLKNITQRHLYVQLTAAVNNSGIQEGAEWVASELENAKQ